MTRGEHVTLQVSNLLVCITGIVYAGMRYLLKPLDEWAVVNHPWQPHVQHLHVLAAPTLVFACGLIWRRHVLGRLRNGEGGGRHSGPALLFALVPMTVSGYLIQTTVTEAWRQTWVGVHLATSAAWIALFTTHVVRAWMARPRAAIGYPEPAEKSAKEPRSFGAPRPT